MNLLFVGDIAFSNLDPIEYKWRFPEGINKDRNTRIIFNWELPIGEKINPAPRTSGPRLLSHPGLVDKMSEWSPGFAALATNHILDAGDEGLEETINKLQQAGFQTVGAGLSIEDIKRPLIWETSEGRLAVVNWVFAETHPDWNAVPGPNCWPGLSEARKTIQWLKNDTDWVIILAHWSDELFSYPRPEDRMIAHELASMGADMIIGHHPHVIRGLEVINNCPVFYSIGNFYFSNFQDQNGKRLVQQSPKNREGLGIIVKANHNQSLTFQSVSFKQNNQQTILDVTHQAESSMRHLSTPLSKYELDAYSEWYKGKRLRFDRLWIRWHFGLRRIGFKGIFLYTLRHLLRNSTFLIQVKR